MSREEAPDLPGARRPAGPTRRDAVAGLRRELEDAGVESPAVEAERLVAHALGLGRTALGRAGEVALTTREAGRIARAAARRLAGEPLQHIEGTVEFRELVLVADSRALIPRPETEQLVDRVIAWVRARPGSTRPLATALDIGTGSGAIALALVAEGVARRVVGVDVSAEALEQAAENRARVGLAADRVELRLTSRPVWTAVRSGERFDLIVSNPPYVSDAEMRELPPEVGQAEPRVALAGGRDGLDLVREIVGGARKCLAPGGALFLEIGSRQGGPTVELLRGQGWRSIELLPDLAGRDRFVRAE